MRLYAFLVDPKKQDINPTEVMKAVDNPVIKYCTITKSIPWLILFTVDGELETEDRTRIQDILDEL